MFHLCVYCLLTDVPMVTMVTHDLVLHSRAVPVCVLVELEVDSNMATPADSMLAIIKSLVIVVLVTVVSKLIDEIVYFMFCSSLWSTSPITTMGSHIANVCY